MEPSVRSEECGGWPGWSGVVLWGAHVGRERGGKRIEREGLDAVKNKRKPAFDTHYVAPSEE